MVGGRISILRPDAILEGAIPPTVTIPIPGPDGTREREDEVIGWNIPENMVRGVALFRLPVVRPLEGSSGRGLTKRA